MKRRTFIGGSIATAVAVVLPGSAPARLPPISIGSMRVGPVALRKLRMLEDFEAAEMIFAQSRAWICGHVVPVEIIPGGIPYQIKIIEPVEIDHER